MLKRNTIIGDGREKKKLKNRKKQTKLNTAHIKKSVPVTDGEAEKIHRTKEKTKKKRNTKDAPIAKQNHTSRRKVNHNTSRKNKDESNNEDAYIIRGKKNKKIIKTALNKPDTVNEKQFEKNINKMKIKKNYKKNIATKNKKYNTHKERNNTGNNRKELNTT
ncbi:hypothetical protein [Terrisporobacter glycolicus]|uniref:hypothetical protein n=1 Tax=Terrisporobacter glycolicus TaxID=36841 RepID=UPI0004122459|nr:hypothetical protein [Terrisporobacter glycolicus]